MCGEINEFPIEARPQQGSTVGLYFVLGFSQRDGRNLGFIFRGKRKLEVGDEVLVIACEPLRAGMT